MVQSVAAPNPGFQMVVAYENSRGIGLKGGMPWKLPKDMAYFKSLTSSVRTAGKQNAVVMGRTTWESIPAKFRPLKGRMNIVISRCGIYRSVNPWPQAVHSCRDGVQVYDVCRTMPQSEPIATTEGSSGDGPDAVAGDLDSALRMAYDADSVEQVFVIGGASVYSLAIQHSECMALHVTQIQSSIECDTFFPEHPASFKLWSQGHSMRAGDHSIQFKCYVRSACLLQIPCL